MIADRLDDIIYSMELDAVLCEKKTCMVVGTHTYTANKLDELQTTEQRIYIICYPFLDYL